MPAGHGRDPEPHQGRPVALAREAALEDEDDRRLSRRLDTLSFALQVYFLQTASSKSGASQTIETEPEKPPSILDEVRNEEVRMFWEERIGQDSSFIAGQRLCDELVEWLGIHLDQTTADTLLLRLDEYAIGGVSPSSLDNFVGQRSIRDALSGLGVIRKGMSTASQCKSVDRSTIKPLLVWIDDEPLNNDWLIDNARQLNITVICLTCTASAKVWIEVNEGLLRKADYAGRLRFISDNYRWEADGINTRSVLNITAGEAILRYLRGRMYRAPVMIYCGLSIAETAYVKSFSRAGSTTDWILCLRFIKNLAAGIDTDYDWEGFSRLS
ncbi:hypothetical protein DENSPDRAFT_415885 [Dentipellis sp. KUC8613]|nr:hypothetical protein DENSPDRAFT_415885 [Dentipellis sp. KUC8613]